ncbi:ABC transporter ATP-binding protein [Salipiger sp. P9]|uniref:ABC transporter ATP-binding protein n=1 Tax=Salipiger pentaromativorans TaxID=2943193 RepID=UPI0021573C4C|nr:ABC transporter ATP-binding protein [Salipiger pentaromativorans]MCR8548895.1 ABC transporter ATP-binding protein [Salipiger pentaromativorans]
MPDDAIQVDAIQKLYGTMKAVDDVSFSVAPGEFVSLLGPSGCGKTTSLRMIAGFIEPSGGSIRVHGRDVTHLPPEKRDVGFVFQNYALWPHMTVAENVAFGLKLRRKSRREIAAKIEESLSVTGLSGYEDRLPKQLSGGQQQRVALARALALEPELLLMDEPLSNLDRALRVTMRRELKELQARMKMTTLYVTHDQEEALSMSNRVVIMNGGRVEQIARPYELYETPASSFVADFVGITNFFEGTLMRCAEDWDEVRLASGQVLHARAGAGQGGQPGDAVRALIRPERVTLLSGPEEGANILRGQVMLAEYFGAVLRYSVRLDSGETLRLEVHNFDAILENGTPVHVRVPPEHLRVLPLDGRA